MEQADLGTVTEQRLFMACINSTVYNYMIADNGKLNADGAPMDFDLPSIGSGDNRTTGRAVPASN
jgi:hypothetical protein